MDGPYLVSQGRGTHSIGDTAVVINSALLVLAVARRRLI